MVVPGIPHHLTQRGNRGMPTFLCDEDYVTYTDLMAEWCEERGVEVWAAFAVHQCARLALAGDARYAARPSLMPNHVQRTGSRFARTSARAVHWVPPRSSPAFLTSFLLRARILHHLKDFPCTVSSTCCSARLRPPHCVKPLIWHNLHTLATKHDEKCGLDRLERLLRRTLKPQSVARSRSPNAPARVARALLARDSTYATIAISDGVPRSPTQPEAAQHRRDPKCISTFRSQS